MKLKLIAAIIAFLPLSSWASTTTVRCSHLNIYKALHKVYVPAGPFHRGYHPYAGIKRGDTDLGGVGSQMGMFGYINAVPELAACGLRMGSNDLVYVRTLQNLTDKIACLIQWGRDRCE